MPEFEYFRKEFKTPASEADALVKAEQSLNREAQMLLSGVGRAARDTVTHPVDKLPELGASLATGLAFGAASRLGTPGRVIAGGIGTAMMLKFGYDELTGKRWSSLGSAMKDTWRSADNLERGIEVTKNSLGSFLVDTGIGCAGMKAGAYATEHFAPPRKLVKDALSRADVDGGAAVLSLQNRWENSAQFQKRVAGDLELITHNQPAEPGEPRGDLIKVARTPDGRILLSAMDVQGHGLSAARKAITAHAALDRIIPEISNNRANDILSKLDGRLNPDDNTALTAAVTTYDPASHELQTATASGEMAYLLKADGSVRRLCEEGGFGLGLNMYNDFSRGNEVIKLGKGDTVILASDGVFDRFARGNWGGLPESTLSLPGFKAFLEKVGPNPSEISKNILLTPPPKTGVDDASFVIFRRPL